MENMFLPRSQGEVVLRGSLLGHGHPGSAQVMFTTPGPAEFASTHVGGPDTWVTDPAHPGLPELIAPCLPEEPQRPLFVHLPQVPVDGRRLALQLLHPPATQVLRDLETHETVLGIV